DPSSLASRPFRGNGSQRPLERGLTYHTRELAPRTATGMAIRTDIATTAPTIISTGHGVAELVLVVQLAPVPTRGDDQWWSRRQKGGAALFRMLTGRTERPLKPMTLQPPRSAAASP